MPGLVRSKCLWYSTFLRKENSVLPFFFYLCMVNLRTLSTDQIKWRQIIGYFINHKWERILKEVVLPDLNFYPGIWWSDWCGSRENSVTIADVRSGIWNLYLPNMKPEYQSLEAQFDSTHPSCYCVWINWMVFKCCNEIKKKPAYHARIIRKFIVKPV